MATTLRLSIALSAALTLTASAARAAVDQENVGTIAGGYTINSGVLGQSFVPGLDALSFVELQINDQNPGTGGSDDIAVRIHAGAIDGSVIGTSQTVSFHDQVPQTFQAPELVHFDFAAPVALTPGQIYVLEPFRPTGGAVSSDLGIFGTGFNNDPYASGTAFFHGAAVAFSDPANAPFDLWFREGTPVPLPAAAWLFAPALAGLGVFRRR